MKNKREYLWRIKNFVFQKKAYLYTIFAVITWATAPLFFKVGVMSLSFGTAVFWFLLFGGVFLTILGAGKIKKVNWKRFILFSVIVGIATSAHYLGYVNSIISDQQVSLTVAVVKTSTLFQILFAIIFLKTLQKQSKTSIVRIMTAALICFIGAVIVTTNLQFQSFQLAASVLSALLAAICWGFLLTMINKSEQDRVLTTGVSLLLAALFTWIFSYFAKQPLVLPKETSEWLWLFYLGAIPTALAVALWIKAQDIVGKRQIYKIIIFEFFVPVISVISCVLFLKETVSGIFLIGLTIIVIGIVLSTDELFKRQESSA